MPNKKCSFEDCVTRASFGPPNGKAECCSKHKGKGYVNLKYKRCSSNDCNTLALFGLPGGRPAWCSVHRAKGAVDLVNSTCLDPYCTKRPTYNEPGKQPIACYKHRSLNMVNTKTTAVSLCQQEGCIKQKGFGLKGSTATHCKNHALDGSINLKVSDEMRCQEPGCKTRCSYGVKPERCELHKEPTDINLIEGQCSKCNLTMPLIDNLCEFCRPQKLKTKELKVKDYLERFNSKNDLSFYSYDKIIDSKCNLKRPDFVYDAGSHFVVVEVDEHQHKSLRQYGL